MDVKKEVGKMYSRARKGYNYTYYQAHREERIAKQTEWNKNHAEEVALYQRNMRRRKMRCEFCGSSFDAPGYVLKYKRKHFCNEECLGKYLVDVADEKISREWFDTRKGRDINVLKVGDTIKCHDNDDMVEYMMALNKEGVETDFVYELNGVKGLWLEIVKIN